MSKYTPHTSADVKAMLDAVGLDSLDALYADVPEKLMLKKLGLGQGMSQAAVERKYEKTASENKVFDTVLRGCGAYDHFIPAAVRSLAARSEFVTAYTPYQPEISQGILQTIFEYQTLMCELTGMDVSNASVYDVGTAVGEAMIMACEKKQGFGSRRGQSRNRCRGKNLRLRFGLQIGGNSPQKRSCRP